MIRILNVRWKILAFLSIAKPSGVRYPLLRESGMFPVKYQTLPILSWVQELMNMKAEILSTDYADRRDRLLSRIRRGKIGVIADAFLLPLLLMFGLHLWITIVIVILFVVSGLVMFLDAKRAARSLEQLDGEIAGLESLVKTEET